MNNLIDWYNRYIRMGYTPNQFKNMMSTYASEGADITRMLPKNYLYELLDKGTPTGYLPKDLAKNAGISAWGANGLPIDPQDEATYSFIENLLANQAYGGFPFDK